MRTFCGLFSAVTTAAVSLVFCTAAFADAPKPLNLTIENHQKLVTVKDANGSWLFAQVISTPNLEITQVSLGKNLSRISLQDASGKTLWSKSLNCGIGDVTLDGEWVAQFSTVEAGLLQARESLGVASPSTTPRYNFNSFEYIIGSEDQLVSTQIVFDKHHVKLVPLKNGVAAKMDGKDLLVVLPQQSPSQTTTTTTTTSVVQASTQ